MLGARAGCSADSWESGARTWSWAVCRVSECGRWSRAAASRLTAEHVQPGCRGQWDSGWDTHGVRASPGGEPLGVSERVYREPAERGRGTRAFNPTRLLSVDAVPKRTRAWLDRRADGLAAAEHCAARNKRATIDSARRALRRAWIRAPRTYDTLYLYDDVRNRRHNENWASVFWETREKSGWARAARGRPRNVCAALARRHAAKCRRSTALCHSQLIKCMLVHNNAVD